MKQKTGHGIALWCSIVLLFALLLSGCSGEGSTQISSQTQGGSSSQPDASQVADASAEVVDFSKYNAYLDVLNDVYEMDGLINDYFTVVQYQPEFALADSMDYSMLEDAFTYYIFTDITIDGALSYTEKEPSYPDQDQSIIALEEPFRTMGNALNDLATYIKFGDYTEDQLAQAAQLHTQLYNAVSAFDSAAAPFAQAMDVLDQQTEQQALDSLKAQGLEIAYYSQLVLNLCTDIDGEIWEQVMASETEALPALDTTNLETFYAQYQDAYANLTQALSDPEQAELMWSREAMQEVYTDACQDVDACLGNLMADARNQADYSGSYTAFGSAVSYLIDLFNSGIAG